MILNAKRPKLISDAIKFEGAKLTNSGAIVMNTGKITGRSPKAKQIVLDTVTKKEVDWDNNEKISEGEWLKIKSIFKNNHGSFKYRQNVIAGRDSRANLKVEINTKNAWHSLFASNMFTTCSEKDFTPNFRLFHNPDLTKEPRVVISFSERMILISGTEYAGEIKKSVFTILNFMYPERGFLPMHCSVNTDLNGKNAAVFFGLSGTGKTTLSADSNRMLLGDDEHGWTDWGLCNFEGGCYAKTIKLNKKSEPEIWNACHRFGAILENVDVNKNGRVNFDSNKFTENTRASYPIEFIEGSNPQGFVDVHPTNIIMLTCDAFGVLPPVAKLNAEEAAMMFKIGYTAKVAGTERGITKPEATFSPCFGLPFMPLPAEAYADILKDKIDRYHVNCWLVNTGWTGGPYGVGQRMPIKITRQIIDSIHSGELNKCSLISHAPTLLNIPNAEFIPKEILLPEEGWKSKEKYLNSCRDLMKKFQEFSGVEPVY